MALIKFGSLVTEGSGSLGGHTLQHSKGGMQLRTKPIPRGRPSAEQYAIRSINPVLQAGWRALTDAQRKIWNDYAQDYGIMNANGDKHPLSGHSLWMKYNFSWIQAGGTFLPDPSYWGGPILGPELIKNGSFSSDTQWQHPSSWNISGGKANYLATNYYWIGQPITLLSGFPCRLSFDISNSAVAAHFFIRSDDPISLFPPPWSGFLWLPNGHYSLDSATIVDTTDLRFSGVQDGGTFSLDNVSLKQIF